MNTVGLFAGTGGAAFGHLLAGLHHLALVEYDSEACATLREAGFPVVEGDVRDLDALQEAIGGQAVDLICAGFPCQPFSTAGARLGADDPRNGWPWTLDAIDRLQPRWFLGENVRGLTLHRAGCPGRGGRYVDGCAACYLQGEILPALRARYAYVEARVLDAADYGVPQHRRRLIIVAGPRPIDWPEATHGPGRAAPYVSMGEALGIGPAPTVGTKGNQYVTMAGSRPELLDRPALTVTTTEVKGTRGDAMGKVMACGTRRGGPDRASDQLWLATGRRRLTPEECAVLQGFPPDWPFRGTKVARYRQVGNAVPPRLAEVVARAILAADNE